MGVYVLTDSGRHVLKALENQKYEWRTLEGLATETGVDPNEIRQILAGALSDQVITTRDKSGRVLYTTRRHYQRSQTLLNRLLTVLSDRVR